MNIKKELDILLSDDKLMPKAYSFTEVQELLKYQRAKESHKTENGWCCACDYDLARIEKEKKLSMNEAYEEGKTIGRHEAELDLEKEEEELTKDRKTAKRCLNYQGFRCKRKECLNESCPLNKVNEEEK